MVVGEGAVDLGEDGEMLARQARDQAVEDRPGGAVAGVPADAEVAALEVLDQPVDIGLADVGFFDAAFAFAPIARRPARRPSAWISSPNTERPLSSILKPL